MTRTLRRRNLVGGLLILLVLAFISLVFFDASIVQNVTTARYPFLYRPVRFLTDFGEGGIYFTIVILLGLFSWGVSVFLRKVKRQDPGVFSRLARWCAWALMSMLIAGIFLQILKHLIGRQRPHVSDGIEPHVFDFFTFNWHFHSMPSGHSQTVFTFTTLLWVTFPRLGAWIFTIPAILALTRIPLEEHFLSDVLLGACLGILVPILVSHHTGHLTLIDETVSSSNKKKRNTSA